MEEGGGAILPPYSTEIERLHSENNTLLAVQKVQKERIEDLEKASGFYIQEVEAWKRLSEKALYPSQEEQKKNPWWKFW